MTKCEFIEANVGEDGGYETGGRGGKERKGAKLWTCIPID